ncbi:MAG: hypothetical protein R3B47_04425 [Bacteroidia bacterium]
MLHKGQVELYVDAEGDPRLVDICDDGDIFGSRAILAGQSILKFLDGYGGHAGLCHPEDGL